MLPSRANAMIGGAPAEKETVGRVVGMEGEGVVKMPHFEGANVSSRAFLKAFKNSKSWIRIRDPGVKTGSGSKQNHRIRIRNPVCRPSLRLLFQGTITHWTSKQQPTLSDQQFQERYLQGDYRARPGREFFCSFMLFFNYLYFL